MPNVHFSVVSNGVSILLFFAVLYQAYVFGERQMDLKVFWIGIRVYHIPYSSEKTKYYI